MAAQGIGSDNKTYRDSATNVAALSSLNLKNELKALIANQVKEAYRKGYNDNARDCYCRSVEAPKSVLPHKQIDDSIQELLNKVANNYADAKQPYPAEITKLANEQRYKLHKMLEERGVYE